MRAHHYAPADDDWRARVLAAAERAARSSAPGSLAAVLDALGDGAGPSSSCCPPTDDARCAAWPTPSRASFAASLHGFTFAVGHSRVATDPVDLYRAGHEALLAANVAEAGDEERRCSPSRTPAPTGCCCRR